MKKIYAVSFILTLIFLVTYIVITSARISISDTDPVRPFSDDWTTESGDRIILGKAKPADLGETFVLTKELPADLAGGECFCFESRNCTINIYVDDRKIYSHESKVNYTGIGYGNYFHEVPLDESDSGHVIRLEMKAMYKRYGRFMSAYIGMPADYIHMNIIKRTLAALISGLIVFLGLVMLGMYFSIPDKENMPFNILALGTSTMIIGTWMLMDTNIMQLITGKVYLWRGLSKSVIFLAVYPCVVFFNSITRLKKSIYQHIAFWFNAAIIAAALISRFLFNVDMIDSFVVVIAVMLGGVLILMVIIFADNFLYCRSRGIDPEIRKFYMGGAVFIICGIADVSLYVAGIRIGDSYGIFSRFGLVFFIILSMFQFLGWWTRDRADIERERFVNRTLQYAMSSNTPDESIRSMLDFMGRELNTKRICIFEDRGSGKYHGTYEWFKDGEKSANIDMIFFNYEGFVDELYRSFKDNGGHLIVADPEVYKSANPKFYYFTKQYDINNIVTGPLERGGELKGFLAFIDSPSEFLEETAHVINIVSYFLNQLITQREEQERLRYYSYNDALSGALNRRAFNEYIEEGLDTSAAFGLMICHINGFEEANRVKGYEAGDNMILNTVNALTEVFGKEHVYRIGGAEFAVFGFETDETFYDADVARVRNLTAEKDLNLSIGPIYCAYGTMDINKVIKHANILMRDDI